MDKTNMEAEQINHDDESELSSEQLVVEIPTEIRAGVVARALQHATCGSTYACYSQRAAL